MHDLLWEDWIGESLSQYTGEGQWTLVELPRHASKLAPYVLSLDFETLKGKRVSYTDSTPYFVGKQPPYRIHKSLGDPDAGEVLILQRISPADE
jgi:hypothetical protein